MKTKIGMFIKNEEGQGMAEYGLILVLVAISVIGAVTFFGSATNQLFQKAITSIPS